jgi:MFS family permease
MDSVIYALVLSPALHELLPKSGYAATPASVSYAGSMLFAVFLVGWGLSFVWGPIADRYGRTRVLAGTILMYAVFTAAAALAQSVWQLGVFRLLAGIGIGGEWALAGTYVAEAWPEDRRKMGAGYLQTGYYAGFFLASALNYTLAARYGWRAMFWCGLTPVIVAFLVMFAVREPSRWEKRSHKQGGGKSANMLASLRAILRPPYALRTLVNSVLLTAAICGLWAAAVYTPTALIDLGRRSGMAQADAVRLSSAGMGLLSAGTILGCIAAPALAERLGRKAALAIYFAGMAVSIVVGFGWAFAQPDGLTPFVATLFVLGFFGGNFAIFSLWLPEQYGTGVRATAFAFTTSIGRFLAAGVNLALGAMIGRMGSLGVPVACTAIAFGLGLLAIPFAAETRGQKLPE